MIASLITDYSMDKGYYVTVRGNLGASFISFLLGFTEINPLKAHYICPKCHWIDPTYGHLAELEGQARTLSSKPCLSCGERLQSYGADILIEMAWGYPLSKEPEICLNVAPEIAEGVLELLKERFGEDRIIGAGTKLICDDDGTVSYGTHPGGIFIIPEGVDVDTLTELKPCTREDGITLDYSQRDYHEMEKYLKKYDILSDKRLGLLHQEEIRAHFSSKDIPVDGTWLDGVSSNRIIDFFKKMNNLILPGREAEFYEGQIASIIDIVSPKCFNDIVIIECLMHIDFYSNHIEDRKRLLRDCNEYGIICRDDLLDKILSVGIDIEEAYKIMLHISRGRGVIPEIEKILQGRLDTGYIRTLKEIRYLYPRSMTVSYAMISWRLLYYYFILPNND